MILATVAAEVERGWGGHLGILGGLVGAYLIWRADLYIKNRWGAADSPSPAETGAPAPREIARSSASRLTSHDDETPAEAPREDWWGVMRKLPDGSIGRVWNGAKEIARTGNSPQAYGDEPVGGMVDDDEIDLALGDVPDDDADHEAAPVSVRRETREEYVERCVSAGVKRADIVAALQEHYGVSRAQAYRLVPAEASGQRAA